MHPQVIKPWERLAVLPLLANSEDRLRTFCLAPNCTGNLSLWPGNPLAGPDGPACQIPVPTINGDRKDAATP